MTNYPKIKNKFTQTTKNTEGEKSNEQDSNEIHLREDQNKVTSELGVIQNERSDHYSLEEQQSKRQIKETELTRIEEKLYKLEKLLEETTLKITNSYRGEITTENHIREQDNYTEAAVLIKSLVGSKISEIQEIINAKLMEIEHLPIFFSRTTKNRKVIIIKTQTNSIYTVYKLKN